MRIGFVTQLLWSRYGDFWVKLVAGVGLEPVLPEPERVRRLLTDARLGHIPGLAFRLAAAQALSLEVDALIVPELNPAESATRGGGQDAFIANFPEALATTVGGLPPLSGVPVSLAAPALEGLAVSTLLALTHDPARVRRAWERQRQRARPPHYPEPVWRVQPSTGQTVAVIGQPWLLNDALARAAVGEQHYVSQRQLDPALLVREGRQVAERLVSTDLEVLGAARYLGRKGTIGAFVMIVDEQVNADTFLLKQVRKLIHKPLTVWSLQGLELPALEGSAEPPH